MSLAIFVSNYPGTVDDATRALLLDNGATGGTIPDMWMQFFAGFAITTGTIDDRMRRFLLSYTGVVDGDHTIDDLWGMIDSPFSL